MLGATYGANVGGGHVKDVAGCKRRVGKSAGAGGRLAGGGER